MAKLADLPSRKILSFQQIVAIAVDRPTSILEVQQILDNSAENLELVPKILEILALES